MGDLMSKNNLIVWEKWVDPFDEEVLEEEDRDLEEEIVEYLEEKEKNGKVNAKKLIKFIKNELEEIEHHNHKHDFIDLIEEEIDEDQILPPNHMMPMKAIITPIGLMPMSSLSMSEIFNFWIGYSNFSITKDIANVIEQSDGVEVLDIITRYRFRVAIGKIFTDRDVMKKINDNVYEHIDKYYD